MFGNYAVGRLEYQSPNALSAHALEKFPIGFDFPEVDFDRLTLKLKDGKRLNVASIRPDAEVRNVLVWILIAAGVPSADVAGMFEITASRCNSIAARCQEKYMTFPPSKSSISHGSRKGKTPEQRAKIKLSAGQAQMMCAEYLLTRAGLTPIAMLCISKAREVFSQRFDKVAGIQCDCDFCVTMGGEYQPHRFWIYWPQAQVAAAPAQV